MNLLALSLAFLVLVIVGLQVVMRSRNIHIWIADYLTRSKSDSSKVHGPIHVLFCFVDHFEPKWHNPDAATATARVDAWVEKYCAIAKGHLDADGHHPVHTFFFPEEEYEYDHLEKLKYICEQDMGEVEIHLHHDNDTQENFCQSISGFVQRLHQDHGFIGKDQNGELAWGFIHGNWSLDNSLPSGRWCGLNNELQLLSKLGCYADFTLPSAPSPAQTAKVNSIYYATDDPNKPKSHNHGVDVVVSGQPEGDLMLIQGPLALDWGSRKFGVIPKIENSDIRAAQPPTLRRMKRWVDQAIGVQGRPEWVFVKVHTHGTQEHDMPTLLGPEMDRFFSDIERHYNDGERYKLHYVSAREMYNIAKAAEAGCSGNPGDFRDYVISKPTLKVAVTS